MAVTPATKRRPTFEQFFAFRRLWPALAFSADGKSVLFSSNISGQFNLWRVPTGGPDGWPEQLTSFDESTVRAIAVSPDDETILFSADADGDEFFQVYALARDGGWPKQWTEGAQVQHWLPPHAWSPDGTRIAYSANARIPTDSELWVRNVASGEAEAVFGEGRSYTIPASWSPDARFIAAIDFRSNTDCDLFLVDVSSGEARHLTPHEGEMRYAAGPWAADGSGFYLLTDEGREFMGLAFFRLADEGFEWIETPDAEIEELAGSADGRILVWNVNRDGWSELHVRDVETGHDLPSPRLPRGCVGALGSGLVLSADGRCGALIWQEARRPPDVYVFETETGEAWPVTDSTLGGLRGADLGEPDLVSFTTFDGREIPAWLYRPEGDGRVPVVLAIHGGPEAQERPWYQPVYQYLRSRGIGVLAPNIRGSSGYGKTYQQLIHRDWMGGDLEDFRHAAEWLRAQDWVDVDRLAVAGGSYGGFATLACVTRLPEYWAAAVDIVGPSNLVTFAKAVPPTWRRMMKAWVGDPETEADFLLERSPITYVDNVRAPLLVIQGANDPRVVKAESDQMVDQLRSLGREVEYAVFEDEGHGFTKRENEVRAWRLAAEWLERHLLGER